MRGVYGSKQHQVDGGISIISQGRPQDMEMAKNERTSKRVGKIASKLLKSKKTSKKAKSVSGSALTQRPDDQVKLQTAA